MKLIFTAVETVIETKLGSRLEYLTQKHNRIEMASVLLDECVLVYAEEQDLTEQVLRMQKKLLIDLQKHFERYCNVVPVFVCNTLEYDINVIKHF